MNVLFNSRGGDWEREQYWDLLHDQSVLEEEEEKDGKSSGRGGFLYLDVRVLAWG